MKVYIDHNLPCGVVKEELAQEEVDALKDIRGWYKEGRLDLRISRVHHRELEPYRDLERKEDIEKLLADFAEAPFVDDHEVLGFHNQYDQWGRGGSFPLVADDRISSELRKIGVERRDAHHLMVATRDESDAFLTCDESTILNRREEIEEQLSPIYQIRLMKPSEFVVEVTMDEDGKVIWSAPYEIIPSSCAPPGQAESDEV